MAKEPVRAFDPATCQGCPHRLRAGEESNAESPLVDRAADLENRAIEGLTGTEQFKCGLCGCPLKNLELTGMAPEDCPNLHIHDTRNTR